MEEALRAYLLGSSGLTALVSTRVQWGTLAQSAAYPAVVLTRIDGLPDYAMDGPTGLVSSRIQAECWAETYAAAKAVARQVKARISGVDTVVDDGGSPPVVLGALRGGFIEGERDSFEVGYGATGLSSIRLFRVSLDFIIWHSE